MARMIDGAIVRVSYRDLGLRQQTDTEGLEHYDAYVSHFKSDRRYKTKHHFNSLSSIDSDLMNLQANKNEFRLAEDLAHLETCGVEDILGNYTVNSLGGI